MSSGMLWTTSTGLGSMVGAIRRSSGAPNVNNHHSSNIATTGTVPSSTDDTRPTRPRIVRKELSDMRQTLRKTVPACQLPNVHPYGVTGDVEIDRIDSHNYDQENYVRLNHLLQEVPNEGQ